MQARWESAETKLKALAAFLQIVLNISFTCTVKFPVEFQAVLTTLSLFNLDILPALGIQCWFNAYDCKLILFVLPNRRVLLTHILIFDHV